MSDADLHAVAVWMRDKVVWLRAEIEWSRKHPLESLLDDPDDPDRTESILFRRAEVDQFIAEFDAWHKRLAPPAEPA